MLLFSVEFVFASKRHRGYPFSITLYVNGKADSRISTCCEFKHCPKGGKSFVKLGGKLGRFAYGKAESDSNEGMCYRCRADAKLGQSSKSKSKTLSFLPPFTSPFDISCVLNKSLLLADDDYDEDFQESEE